MSFQGHLMAEHIYQIVKQLSFIKQLSPYPYCYSSNPLDNDENKKRKRDLILLQGKQDGTHLRYGDDFLSG